MSNRAETVAALRQAGSVLMQAFGGGIADDVLAADLSAVPWSELGISLSLDELAYSLLVAADHVETGAATGGAE